MSADGGDYWPAIERGDLQTTAANPVIASLQTIRGTPNAKATAIPAIAGAGSDECPETDPLRGIVAAVGTKGEVKLFHATG